MHGETKYYRFQNNQNNKASWTQKDTVPWINQGLLYSCVKKKKKNLNKEQLNWKFAGKARYDRINYAASETTSAKTALSENTTSFGHIVQLRFVSDSDSIVQCH